MMNVYAMMADGSTMRFEYDVMTAYEAVARFRGDHPDAITACAGDGSMGVFACGEDGEWSVELLVHEGCAAPGGGVLECVRSISAVLEPDGTGAHGLTLVKG